MPANHFADKWRAQVLRQTYISRKLTLDKVEKKQVSFF